MNAVHGRVSRSGRINLPAEFRRAVGLDHGGDVIVELDGRDIRIRTVDEVVERSQALAQRLLAGKPAASVDAFIEERRRDASKEP